MNHDDIDRACEVLDDRLHRVDQEAKTLDAALAGLKRMRDELDAPHRTARPRTTLSSCVRPAESWMSSSPRNGVALPPQLQILNFFLAGVASTLPEASTARTLNLCLPSESFLYFFGELQDLNLRLSSLH